MTSQDILNPENWNDGVLKEQVDATTIKYLNERAAKVHSLVDSMNKFLIGEKFIVNTILTVVEEDSHYSLEIEIKHYGSKEEYQHKENSHEQRVNI